MDDDKVQKLTDALANVAEAVERMLFEATGQRCKYSLFICGMDSDFLMTTVSNMQADENAAMTQAILNLMKAARNAEAPRKGDAVH